MTGSGAGAAGIGVGVAAGVGVGVALTVTVRVASCSVSGCFGVGVGSTTFGGSMGSVPCVSLSSMLVGDVCELSCFILATLFCLSFSLLSFLNNDTVGLKFIPVMICLIVVVILVVAWSVAGVDSALTMRGCCAGFESGGAVWHPLTLTKRTVVRRAVRACSHKKECNKRMELRKEQWDYDKELYKQRNRVERLSRRVFTRFDMLDLIFLAFIYFALILDALM